MPATGAPMAADEPCESLFDTDRKSYDRRMQDDPDLWIAMPQHRCFACTKCGGCVVRLVCGRCGTKYNKEPEASGGF